MIWPMLSIMTFLSCGDSEDLLNPTAEQSQEQSTESQSAPAIELQFRAGFVVGHVDDGWALSTLGPQCQVEVQSFDSFSERTWSYGRVSSFLQPFACSEKLTWPLTKVGNKRLSYDAKIGQIFFAAPVKNARKSWKTLRPWLEQLQGSILTTTGHPTNEFIPVGSGQLTASPGPSDAAVEKNNIWLLCWPNVNAKAGAVDTWPLPAGVTMALAASRDKDKKLSSSPEAMLSPRPNLSGAQCELWMLPKKGNNSAQYSVDEAGQSFLLLTEQSRPESKRGSFDQLFGADWRSSPNQIMLRAEQFQQASAGDTRARTAMPSSLAQQPCGVLNEDQQMQLQRAAQWIAALEWESVQLVQAPPEKLSYAYFHNGHRSECGQLRIFFRALNKSLGCRLAALTQAGDPALLCDSRDFEQLLDFHRAGE